MRMPRLRFTVRQWIAIVALIAIVLAADSVRRARRRELAAWLNAKAIECRALADIQERTGSLIVAKYLREEADRCDERAKAQLPLW